MGSNASSKIQGNHSPALPPNDFDSLRGVFDSNNPDIKPIEEIQNNELVCSKIDCHEIPISMCECLGKATLFCQTHLDAHNKQHHHNKHLPKMINPRINAQKLGKSVNYLQNYSTNLKNFKKNIVLKVIEHFEKVNNDISLLLIAIDSLISMNNQKILDLMRSNLEVLESIAKLVTDSQRQFTEKCDQVEISKVCLDIIQDEINDWNATMTNLVIAKIKTKNPKLDSKNNDGQYESVDDKISSLQRLPGNQIKPLLHYCWSKTDEIHYYDWYWNTYKSIRIDGLNILLGSRSISIDHNSILLLGGWPDSKISKTNENMSKVFEINLWTKSLKSLPSMNTGRADFCISFLNGFYYVLGGLDYQKHKIKKCERYSLKKDRWEYISNLNQPRNAATCVSIPKENWIYVIGGKDVNHQLNETIEKYDAALNKWTLIKIKKPILRMKFGCCLLPDSDSFLIFGGEDINEKWQNECFFYNYKTNQVTNTNPFICDNNNVLNMPVVFNNKVYCYLRKSFLEKKLSFYDIESGFWSSE